MKIIDAWYEVIATSVIIFGTFALMLLMFGG